MLLCYWVVQMGLLTPWTFNWHCLSPLAVFTSGAYFLHDGGWWQWIHSLKIKVPTLKTLFKARSQSMSSNKQDKRYRMQKNALFPCIHNLQVSWEIMQKHFFFPHPLSLVPSNSYKHKNSGISTTSQFYFQIYCYTQHHEHEATPTQKSA